MDGAGASGITKIISLTVMPVSPKYLSFKEISALEKEARYGTGAGFYFLDGHRRPRLYRGSTITRFRVAASRNFLV